MIATAAAICALINIGPFVRPDQLCTPGSYRALTTRQVCTPKERAHIPIQTKRTILRRYGLPTQLPWRGKYDHRIPHFMGGTDTARNLWPVPFATFPKDRLENYVRNRICRWRTMRVRYAYRIFQGNWVLYWRKYLGGAS